MDKFWELLKESVITQALITFILVVTTCYMFILGKVVPELLSLLVTTSVGFFFGAKSKTAGNTGFSEGYKAALRDAYQPRPSDET
jgi:glycerol uptake facilitator-like aquaporin